MSAPQPSSVIVSRWPKTLVLGAGWIAVCELLLYYDVHQRGGMVVPTPGGQPLPDPHGPLGHVARWMALNMTALSWMGYLVLFDGLLTKLAWARQDPSICSIRARPNRFVVAWLTSIPVWCFFDWVNFAFMDAWRYYGLPQDFNQRVLGYFIAFAAISPGMFLAAQLYQQLGLRRLVVQRPRVNRWLPAVVMVSVHLIITTCVLLLIRSTDTSARPGLDYVGSAAILLGPGIFLLAIARNLIFGSLGFGLGFTVWAIVVQDPLGNPALWVGLIFLLDPIAAWSGAPSILRDWQAGRWGRMLSLFAGGATCGFLWEFWNYWALAKWTYHLPFLGSLEQFRYFEMPWIGFLGFLPFAVECWVVYNVILLSMRSLSLVVAERLPTDHAIV